MTYIQENLTTSDVAIPSVSWELPDALRDKLAALGGAARLVFNADKTAVVDLVEDADRKAAIEAARAESEARELRKALRKKAALPSATASAIALTRTLLAQALPQASEETRLALSGLFEPWTAGKHAVGELCNAQNQSWECFQAHDNAVYPDITPGNAAWFTFWKPLHGKSPDTARLFVQPTGAHDVYKTGECMIWTDGKVYQCLSDTAYSPTDYAAAWEVVG